jgi:hypothetical protein
MENKPIWEQQEGEPDEAYTRFLIYRNLGPARTIEKAAGLLHDETKGKKTKVSTSQWTKDSAEYNWRERAAKWDIAMLSSVVPETAAYIFAGIREFAKITLEHLQSGTYSPKNWAEVKDSLVTLAGFVAPEIITNAVDNAQAGGANTEVPAPRRTDGDG